MKAQAEREAEAKIYDDAHERLKELHEGLAKVARNLLKTYGQDVQRPSAVRNYSPAKHRAARKLAVAVMDAPEPVLINLEMLLADVDLAADFEAGRVAADPKVQATCRKLVNDIGNMEGVESVKISAPGHRTVTIPGGEGKRKGRALKASQRPTKKRLRDVASKPFDKVQGDKGK
jgi:hypothetical protein